MNVIPDFILSGLSLSETVEQQNMSTITCDTFKCEGYLLNTVPEAKLYLNKVMARYSGGTGKGGTDKWMH